MGIVGVILTFSAKWKALTKQNDLFSQEFEQLWDNYWKNKKMENGDLKIEWEDAGHEKP